jgi:hypothetical protein
MALEQDIQKMTSSVDALTAALTKFGPAMAALAKSQGGAADETEVTAKPAPGKKKAAAPKVTFDEVKAKAKELKEAKGTEVLKEVVGEIGVANFKEMQEAPGKWDAFMEAADAAMGGDDDDLGL